MDAKDQLVFHCFLMNFREIISVLLTDEMGHVAAMWEECIEELYDDPDRAEEIDINDEEVPDFLKSEVE